MITNGSVIDKRNESLTEADALAYGIDPKSLPALVDRERMLKAHPALAESMSPGQYVAPSYTSALAGFVITAFRENKEAKVNGGIEKDYFDCLRAYNGEYNPEDLAKIIASGGSRIFINLTGLKCRAGASWIRDIQMPAKGPSWSVEPTPVPDLPQDIKAQINKAIDMEFGSFVSEFKPEQRFLPPQPPPQSQQAQQAQQQAQPQAAIAQDTGFSPQPGNTSQKQLAPGASTSKKAKTLKEFNQAKRDIEDMILDEINKVAKHEMKIIEREIADQLAEGNWDKALSEFIDDFVVVPTAFLKGPIISRDMSLTYVNGKPVSKEKYIYLNKRVSGLDMYPSANSTGINDGDNIIEHLRFTHREIAGLKGLPGYDSDAIDAVINEFTGRTHWIDSGIEGDKALAERRGDEHYASKGVIHGLHFHGSIPVRYLRMWGLKENELYSYSEYDEKEVECILAGNYIIKCVLNKDPLKRRPYYKASYQNRPGSFWGIALPMLMSDIQRMCNATARALANNMGLSSGPQIEIYVDRLADNSPITSIHPFKIWQLTSDPTGGSGRAINFTQPVSNAAELLAVFKEFELRADDATGIPRYAYGNERVAGAAQTAHGLSLLLESASKAIKDCVRNIDNGVVIPRIESQFYWNMLSRKGRAYTGDPKVIAKGSSTLTMKGAEQMRRNEFLQLTTNPMDQQILGLNGRAEILRRVAEDLNMGESLIPSRLELLAQQEENAAAAQRQQEMAMQLEREKNSMGLQSTGLQANAQIEMHRETQAFKAMELDKRQEERIIKAQIELARLEAQREGKVMSDNTKLQQAGLMEHGKDRRFDTEVALKLKQGEGI